MNDLTFTAQEWLRYTRHIQLAGFGATAQGRLKRARVLVVGLGGLGCPVALYLAAAGVGHLSLVDGDTVDITNLQRQVLYTTGDIGVHKARVARQKLAQLNPDIRIDAHCSHLSWALADELKHVDLVVDCTDNFASRYLINDFCLREKLPWLYASVQRFAGQCALFRPGAACFRCVFPEAPEQVEDCNAVGVLGTVPGTLGMIQAGEALAYLAGRDSALSNKLLMFDAAALETRKITLVADPGCACQAEGGVIDRAAQEYQIQCQPDPLLDDSLEAQPLLVLPSEFADLCHQDGVQVVDVRSPQERELFHIGGDHLPLDQIDHALDVLDREKTVVCYCQSGQRSLAFATALTQQGFCAKSLEGGLVAMLKMSFDQYD